MQVYSVPSICEIFVSTNVNIVTTKFDVYVYLHVFIFFILLFFFYYFHLRFC